MLSSLPGIPIAARKLGAVPQSWVKFSGWRWRFLTLGILCAALSNVWAQSPSSSTLLPAHFLPKSPTLSTIERFDAQQLVNLPTGAAQLAVPLAEVTCGTLRLPVSLAYSYTGMKVYQPRDLVGLGWELQAGSAISLQVQGLVDSRVAGTAAYNADTVQNPSQWYLREVTRNARDSGPDVYTFALPEGLSGRFIIRDTTLVLLPRQAVHIRLLRNQVGNSFQITNEEGVRYWFRATEETHPSNKFGLQGYTSAWHLTHIISADNRDTLQLHYTKLSRQSTPTRCAVTTGSLFLGVEAGAGSSSGTFSCPGPSANDYSFQNSFTGDNRLSPQYLDSITTHGTHLIFHRDINTRVLQWVQLVSTVGWRREIKTITLFQSVFPGGSSADWRVRLDSLQESANGLVRPPYRFQYNNDMLLPARSSSAMDYWGYSNGALLNGSITSPQNNCLLADALLGGNQANREPDFDYAVAGALEKVVYPTGGSASWEYEPGQIWYPPGEVPPVARQPIYVNKPVCGYSAQSPANITVNSPYFHGVVTASDTVHFQVPADTQVIVYLSRLPYFTNQAKNYTNLYKDFDIWRCLPTGDTLITTSTALGAYKSYDPHDGIAIGFNLPTGTYAVRVYCERFEAASDVRIEIPDERPNQLDGQNLPGAGIRVRQTKVLSPGAPALFKSYSYTLLDSLGSRSSGVTLAGGRGINRYLYRQVYEYDNVCVSLKTSSDNSRVGDEFLKYPFYYGCVTVREGTAQGATIHQYGSLFGDVFLFKKQVYGQNLPKPRLLHQTIYKYTLDSTVRVPMLRAYQTQQNAHTYTYISSKEDEYQSEYGLLQAAFFAIGAVRQQQYGGQGDSITNSTYSTYYRQRLVRTASLTSTGWKIQRYKRLSDYVATPSVKALQVNFFNPIIETQTWHRPLGSSDSTLVAGQLTLYHPDWRAPVRSYGLRLDRPQLGLNQENKINGKFTSWFSDTRYEPEITLRYAAITGDLVQQQRTHGLSTSYLMGYEHMLVIAEAKNASYAQVAYTSFEAASTGRWQYDSTGTHRVMGGRTGHYAYQLDGTIGVTRGRLPAGEYELEYWAQNTAAFTAAVQNGSLLSAAPQAVATAPNNWTQYRVRLRLTGMGQVSLNGSAGKLDEVRLYPVGAQLTSFTHEPLVGITSQTGPDGRTIFFEYDGLGRLVRTRDEQGRILSQQQYHYKN